MSEVTLLGAPKTCHMFAVTPVSLEAQFSSAQRDLRRNAAHGGVRNPPLISPPSLGLRGFSGWSGIRKT